MATTPTILGDQAARQLGDMVRWFNRDYRNPAAPPPRQPVIRGGSVQNGFWAIIHSKISIDFGDVSSDPLFNFPDCPPLLQFGGFRFGSYGWVEAEEPDPAGYGQDFGPDVWRWKPLPGGRFGVAGECDQAIEINRSNANIHVEKMVVWMWRGRPSNCQSSENNSSSISTGTGRTVKGISTTFQYFFWLGTPREDCANRYVISNNPQNDFPFPP